MKNPCKYSFFPQMKWFLLQGNLVPELEFSLGGTSVAVWMSPDSETGSVESFGSESADSEKAKISDIS